MMTVNDGLGRIWIETVISFFKLPPQHWPKRAEKGMKTSVRIANFYLDQELGHAIAQAVSHWLPTAAAQVRSWAWSSGICGGQSGTGAGFL
jgi:hypothetical protein